jgi:hypothetical protein
LRFDKVGCLRANIGSIDTTVVSKMAGDPTQTQPETARPDSPALQEWYVVTGGGASAVRMMPGLTVGESDSGALALNDPDVGNQWVEFVLADNGEPWATIVTRDKSLRVAGTSCLRHPLHVGATVRLPNNTLHISRDIRPPRLSETVVEVVHRDIPERLQDLVGPGWEEVLTAVWEPRPATPAVEMHESFDPMEPAPPEAEARLEPSRDAPDDWSDRPLTMAEPPRRMRQPPAATRRRHVAVMGGVLALGAVTLAGVVAVLVSMSEGENARLGNFDPVSVDTPAVRSPAETPAPPAESPGADSPIVTDPVPDPAEVADAGTDGRLAGAAGPAPSRGQETADSRSPPSADRIPPSEPAAATDQEPAQVAKLPEAETELPAPVELPPVERRAISPVEQTAAQTGGAAEAVTGPVTVDRQPDAALVAELEEIGLMAQAVAAELVLRRDLLAADLALAQGRLMTPPETSAYTLYNRVLAVDPGSPEATSGLQSVRQGLINRALAQLAGDDLDDARRTLQSAADAGADPRLIADLRDEVDYRQGLIDAQSRRSETSINSSR